MAASYRHFSRPSLDSTPSRLRTGALPRAHTLPRKSGPRWSLCGDIPCRSRRAQLRRLRKAVINWLPDPASTSGRRVVEFILRFDTETAQGWDHRSSVRAKNICAAVWKCTTKGATQLSRLRKGSRVRAHSITMPIGHAGEVQQCLRSRGFRFLDPKSFSRVPRGEEWHRGGGVLCKYRVTRQ